MNEKENRFCKSCNLLKSKTDFAKAGFNQKTRKQQFKAICKKCHSYAVGSKEKESRMKNGDDYADCSNESCGHAWCYRYETRNRYKGNMVIIKRTCPKCGCLPENLEELN